jgi:hypothetical protein
MYTTNIHSHFIFDYMKNRERDKKMPEHSPFILDIRMFSLPLITLFGVSQGLMSIQETHFYFYL